MAYPGLALKNIFQYGRETAGNYGVAVAATHRLPTYALDVDPHLEVIEPDLSDGSLFTQAMIDSIKRPVVTIELPLTYTGMLLIIDCLMGTATYGSNGGATTGSNPYTHTWKIQELLNSLTLQCGQGDIPTTKVERTPGSKILRAVFSSSGGRNDGRISLTLPAKDWATDVTPTGALLAPALDVVMFKHLSAFNDGLDGNGVGDIQGWELSIDNGLAIRDFAQATADEPIRGGKPIITLSLDEEFQTKSARVAHYAMTQGAPTLTFTSGTKSFVVTMPKAFLKPTPAMSREGMGVMKQRLVWSPIGDDGSPETYITLAVTNAQASITA